MFRHFWDLTGKKPIVPVRDHLYWIAEYIESAEFRKMSEFKLDYESMETGNPDYFPAQYANQILRGLNRGDHSDYENTMPDKYRLAGLDPEMWRGIRINFNRDQAMSLLSRIIDDHGEDFILANNHSQAGSIDIKPRAKGKLVFMEEIPGYTVIDWAWVMHAAKENRHVSTCTVYIMQALRNHFGSVPKAFIYPRPNEDGLRGIASLNFDFQIKRMK